jgi:hypothetical protein
VYRVGKIQRWKRARRVWRNYTPQEVSSEENVLYIVVRNDLPPGLMMAQACHAAECFGWNYRQNVQPIRTTIVLGIDPEKLLPTFRGLGQFTLRNLWYEPDLDQKTAFAVYAPVGTFPSLDLALKPRGWLHKRVLDLF